MKQLTMNLIKSALVAAMLGGGGHALAGEDFGGRVETAIESMFERVTEGATNHDRYERLIVPRVELVEVDGDESHVTLTFNFRLLDRSWHEEDATRLRGLLRASLSDVIDSDGEIDIMVRLAGRGAATIPFEEAVLSTERIRTRHLEGEELRMPVAPVVQHVDYAGPLPTGGLYGRNIFISPAHGWTWHDEQRWQFQRSRLFTIVEDLFPQAFINPFLIPMMENAGAVVYSARERDYQVGEVIVDNDEQTPHSVFELEGVWSTSEHAGWRGGRPSVLGKDEEPFTLGTTLQASVEKAYDSSEPARAIYTPHVPHAGRYAVYISWAQDELHSPSVPVIVRHLGGETSFLVNQQVSGSTWVFLDFFEFAKGTNGETGSIIIEVADAARSNAAMEQEVNTLVNIDAVRLGGGMGNFAAENQISGKPRYAEAARYFAQYSGAPADRVYNRVTSWNHFGLDYWTDIVSRPEWANYIHGAPNGPNGHFDDPGLGVPIDLSISWHTDAGVNTRGLYGTLTIYRLLGQNGSDRFPDGRSRWLNRDLATFMHDEIDRTAREHYTSTWVRRDLSDRNLAEARRTNVPTVLLELLSHQNFNDMKYGLDPRFRRDMARAIYKASLRFIAATQGYDPVIQPLAPSRLSVRHLGGGTAELNWQAVMDPLEPTATPDGYIVYHSPDGKAFDNGTWFPTNTARMEELEEGVPHYFRVTAANAGGQSLPTSVVGLRWKGGEDPILVVDGFDRISGPAYIHEGRIGGFDRNEDPGVGYYYNYGLVGNQYNFDLESEWENDLERNGTGGSSNEWEDRLEKGNSFDHIATIGAILHEDDLPFESATAEAFEAGYPASRHKLIVWISGLQRTVMPFTGFIDDGIPDRMTPEFPVMTPTMVERLERHLDADGRLLLSGAYVGYELTRGPLSSDMTRAFMERIGVRQFRPDSTSINVVRVDESLGLSEDASLFYFGNDLLHPINIFPTVYRVHSAESFSVDPDQTEVLAVYGDTSRPGIISNGQVTLAGFPLESVLLPEHRGELVIGLVRNLLED
ncbi:MAG: N-acetylmuramoyl-L-alanine amidase [Candidatus Sumerlaeia bacterium]|nr:N-acetylmuramoyl-L-alanine amidase [Candidatus Sumerlaeia bacterium]